MVDFDDPTAEPATSTPVIQLKPVLRVVYCGDRILLRDHPLAKAAVEVGRGPPDPVHLKLEHDPRLSRHHATFTVADGKVHLENKSDKGCFKNGARVDAGADLDDGDVVRLGDSFLVVRMVPEDLRQVAIPGVLGRAPAMAQVRSLIDVVGPARTAVVLLGETGTGKDVVARALHERSGRKGPYVVVNCGAVTEEQLFQSIQGAHGGTVFLDEIGELAPAAQQKLLRVLDEKRVGNQQVDVRFVVASDGSIARDVEQKTFRPDLFARLAEITMKLPPLSERREDVLVHLEHALPGLASHEKQVTPQLVNALLNHAWPFNVRELLKIAGELDVKAQGRTTLDLDLLEGRVLGPKAAAAPAVVAKRGKDEVPDKGELERLLQQARGRVSDVARATGRSRTQVYRWIEQMQIDVEQYRR